MLAHREEASKESNTNSHDNSDWQKISVYCRYRKEIYNILKDAESGHNVFHCFLVKEIQQNERNSRSKYTDDKSF